MTRNLLTAGVLLAGLSFAQAQNITPGLGGVALTGQSGAGVFIPYGGGNVTFGAPGVGTYQSGVGYTSPWSWNQFDNPTAYNFNTGSFNYNSGVYGWNNRLTTSGYSGSTYGGVIQSGGYYYPSNTVYYGTRGSSWTTPVYSNGNGRGRWRWR